MATRSYQQYCGLAAAMDVVGERWAMLVVRDLAPGPRRFTDLMRGLPGIATDVLADRLRSLEAAGAVRRTQLRHPVPAQLYELTDRGQELARLGSQLAVWGQVLLPPAGTPPYRIDPRWALQSMVAGHDGTAPDGAYELVIGDEELTITVVDGEARLSYGPARTATTARLTSDPPAFFELARDPRRVGRNGSQVDGDAARLRRVLAAMPLRVGQPA